jgi:hypothetical protein
MGITQTELDLLRAEQEKFMGSLATIKRVSFLGDVELTPVVIATDVPCHFEPGFGTFRSVADQFRNIAAWTLTFPWGQDIKVGDQVVSPLSSTYQVRAVEDTDSTLITAKKVLAERITP